MPTNWSRGNYIAADAACCVSTLHTCPVAYNSARNQPILGCMLLMFHIRRFLLFFALAPLVFSSGVAEGQTVPARTIADVMADVAIDRTSDLLPSPRIRRNARQA